MKIKKICVIRSFAVFALRKCTVEKKIFFAYFLGTARQGRCARFAGKGFSNHIPNLLKRRLENPPVVCCRLGQEILERDHRGMIGLVRYGADAQERHAIDLARVRDGGSFHVGAQGVMRVK